MAWLTSLHPFMEVLFFSVTNELRITLATTMIFVSLAFFVHVAICAGNKINESNIIMKTS